MIQSTLVPMALSTATNPPSPTSEPTATIPPSPTPQPTATPLPPTPPPPAPLPGTELFSFGDSGEEEPRWGIVDDDVMGGVSSSEVEILADGQMRFYGTMSLENNGGFSSVRSEWREVDLSGTDGALIRVKGDGKIYRFRVRTESAGREISYNGFIETKAGEWTVAYVPFAQMVPTFRGFVMNVERLDPATVGSFGFMLSDKQAGEFELLVDWVRAVKQTDVESSDI